MKKSLRPKSRNEIEQEGSTRGLIDLRKTGMTKSSIDNLKKKVRPKARPATSDKSNVGPSGVSSRGFTKLGE